MLLLLLIIFCNIGLNQAVLLQCDFETYCNDFIIDEDWGLTDGAHPNPVNHDHTLNTTSGHYIFYDPHTTPEYPTVQIWMKDWLQPSTGKPHCFRMWYYTPRLYFPFNIQLAQGDDEQLIRIVASVQGKDISIDDWTLINITLPNERIKIFVRLNMTQGPLAFDDISVDYCDGPFPLPSKVLYSCDFESSCSNDFISLPKYTYQWSILSARDAIQIEPQAPSVDYTFGNASGHYAFLTNFKTMGKGAVGYLHLQKEFQITANDSYCLNFQYDGYAASYSNNLRVLVWNLDELKTVQMLWPQPSSNTKRMIGKNWGIINLPVGNYSLLFRLENKLDSANTFALDNIAIISCDYPPTKLRSEKSLLSFSCNFDDLTTCGMESIKIPPSTFNFPVFTGDTIPNQELGPTRDHTMNSSSGGFLYWNRTIPYTSYNMGMLYLSKTIEFNFGMCIKFSYYVKSWAYNKNRTSIAMNPVGCRSDSWFRMLDNSDGWQTVVVPASNIVCAATVEFDVNQRDSMSVSIAFDDIEIDQCNSIMPSTTTSTTSTTSQIITKSTRSSISSTKGTSTIPTSTSASTTRNNSHQQVYFERYNLIIFYLFYQIIRQLIF
ncbi:unnamed protein product [Rotaria sp. Silwood2]|nr:unnamed protein product [Rotaria sp. Silwood2]